MNKFLVVIFLLLTLIFGQSANITIGWNPVQDVTGYKLFYGTESRVYENHISVSSTQITNNYVCGTISNLTFGTQYYFSVTATNFTYESDFSAELVYTLLITNDQPHANNISNLLVYMGESLPIVLSGQDTHSNIHSYTILSHPTKGFLSGQTLTNDTVFGTTPTIIYLASSNIFGYDTFQYSAWNGVESDPASISIVILSTNKVSIDYSHVFNNLVIGWDSTSGILQYRTNLSVGEWENYPTTNNPVYVNPHEYIQCFFRIL